MTNEQYVLILDLLGHFLQTITYQEEWYKELVLQEDWWAYYTFNSILKDGQSTSNLYGDSR